MAATPPSPRWTVPAALAEGLLWPRLLRVAGLALRPARLTLAYFLLVIVGLIVHLPGTWLFPDRLIARPHAVWEDALQAFHASLADQHPHQALGALLRAPFDMAVAQPAIMLVLAPLLAFAWGLLGGAIARSAASELGPRVRMTWPMMLAHAWQKRWSLTLATLGPLLLVGSVVAVLAFAGWALLSWEPLAYVGSVLFGIAAVMGVALAIVVLLVLLSAPMLLASVMIEPGDAIDSVQRALALACAKPARLVLYLLILTLAACACVQVAFWIVRTGLATAAWSTTLLTGNWSPARIMSDARWQEPDAPARIMAWWVKVLLMLVPAYAVSFFCTAGSALYLTMRRLCDGQDEREIWDGARKAASTTQPPGADDESDDEANG